MKDLIKVRIDKCSTSMFWWYHQIGSQINVEEHPIDKSSFKLVGLPQTIKKSDCTALSDTGENDEPALSEQITSPTNEHKAFCIKRTPENAEVLNKWMNSIDWKLRYDRDYGYVISETSDMWGMVYDEIPEGFTELLTVEEFFEKVGYNPVSEYEKQLEEKFIPEPKESNQLKPAPEPVLIAKAGDKVRIVDFGKVHVSNTSGFTLNKPYVLRIDLDMSGKNGFGVLADDNGNENGWTYYSSNEEWLSLGMKFEKVVEEQVKEESERIPFDLKLWESGKYDVVTRNGWNVYIIKTDLNSEWRKPIVGVLCYGKIGKSKETACTWGINGEEHVGERPTDLFLIPKTEKVFVNVWHSECFKSNDDAKIYHEFESFNGLKYVETIEVKRPIK